MHKASRQRAAQGATVTQGAAVAHGPRCMVSRIRIGPDHFGHDHGSVKNFPRRGKFAAAKKIAKKGLTYRNGMCYFEIAEGPSPKAAGSEAVSYTTRKGVSKCRLSSPSTSSDAS